MSWSGDSEKERIHKSLKDPTWRRTHYPETNLSILCYFFAMPFPWIFGPCLSGFVCWIRISFLLRWLLKFCLPGINPPKTVTIGLRVSFGISSLGRSRMRLISAQSKHPPLHVVVKLIPLFYLFSSCPSISILCLILISCPGTEIKSDPFSHPIPFE